ncbi:translation initiation factor IF-2-like [Onychomys torridus]|uniref:translation initiation factor IF-2-like n=1 Tax=Onychomys torridus TaxID=38674 RepID=UPI00167FB563|nr:translation initiation factor IF-2-like [Onychomys torridus]
MRSSESKCHIALRGGGSAGLGTRRREAKAVCKQASSASLRDVHPGPWEGRHARPRPGQTRRAPVWRPARSSRTRPRRNPGPGKGFSAARGLVAPRAPPASRGGDGDPRKKGRGPRAAGCPRRPQCQDAPSAPARELAPGPPERREPASPAARRASLTASPWPGGSSVSRERPPQQGSAAAKPRTPEGAAVAAAEAEARRPSSRIGSGVASATRVRGSAVERVRGRGLRRDDRGAAGGRARRSLGRRGGRSSCPRHWGHSAPWTPRPATAPGLRRPRRARAAGNAKQRGLGVAGAPCALRRPPPGARGPPLTRLPGSRKLSAPPPPPPSDPSTFLPSRRNTRSASFT